MTHDLLPHAPRDRSLTAAAGRVARRLAVLFAGALWLLTFVAAARGQAGSGEEDPLRTVGRWNEQYRRLGRQLAAEQDAPLHAAVEALGRRLARSEEREDETLLALCDLARIAPRGADAAVARGEFLPDEREQRARDMARRALRIALDARAGESRGVWLATSIAALGRDEPLARRIAAAESLAGRRFEAALPALFAAAKAPERGLREGAILGLAGCATPSVDRFLVGLLHASLSADPPAAPGASGPAGVLSARRASATDARLAALLDAPLDIGALVAHFAGRTLALDDPLSLELTRDLSAATSGENWRYTVRVLPLSRLLPDEHGAPLLIEALALWHRRGLAGTSSRRVESELVAELERRSHLRLGHSAERWSSWWKTRRAAPSVPAAPDGPTVPGEASPTPPTPPTPSAADGAGSGSGAEQESRSQATFFGLRPWTDRVIIVVDRSGSMASAYGTGGDSRYSEALRQLELLLVRLGPRTHFGLILFDDSVMRWRRELRPATPVEIAAALQWARAAPPRGGTVIAPALFEALEVDGRSGKADLERLEADTVIVLCDGATTEGADWARSFLKGPAAEACVRFDCVQIGAESGGTLETLARGSGGQFVRG